MNELLFVGIAVLDGAMGTMIQKYELTETDFHTKQISGDTGEIPQELIDCGKDAVSPVCRYSQQVSAKGIEKYGIMIIVFKIHPIFHWFINFRRISIKFIGVFFITTTQNIKVIFYE